MAYFFEEFACPYLVCFGLFSGYDLKINECSSKLAMQSDLWRKI